MIQVAYDLVFRGGHDMMYGQSYLQGTLWEKGLMDRLEDSLAQVNEHGTRCWRGDLFWAVIDSIEKLGMLHLDREMVTKHNGKKSGIDQTLTKFHYYHFVCDSVACLDALACVLNARYSLGFGDWETDMTGKHREKLLKELELENRLLAESIRAERSWIDALVEIRNRIIHRDAKKMIVVDGAPDSCFVHDRLRPDNRRPLLYFISDHEHKIDTLFLRILETVAAVPRQQNLV